MKRKATAGMMLTLFLMLTLFIAFPVEPAFVGTIKIGVLWPQSRPPCGTIYEGPGLGIYEGAKLAVQQINEAGGIEGNTGEFWKVRIVIADTLRGMPQPTLVTVTAAAMELVASGVDFVIGGVRGEPVFGMREVFMDGAAANDKPIFIVVDDPTDELVDCGSGTCGACVRCDYDRYRYVFRNRHNSTMLLFSIASFSKYLMTEKLMPIYTGYTIPLKIAVISEDLLWADKIHAYLSMDVFWNTILGMNAYGDVSVVYSARVNHKATNVSSELLAAEAAGAKLIIPVLSGRVGHYMTIQWADLGINAFLGGINVNATDPTFWQRTGGKCEYETSLAAAGTRTPIHPITVAFWDAYKAKFCHFPVDSSAYYAYDAVMLIKEMIEAAGKWPMGAAEMVPLIEQTYRISTTSRFKFTGPHPMPATEYDDYMANATHNYLQINPTMMGTLHDTFMTTAELAPEWYSPYYTRPLVVQWQAGRLEVVYPVNMPFSKKTKIPPWMYSHADTDIASLLETTLVTRPDGLVSAFDMDAATYCWLSKPGDPAWVAGGEYYGLEADQDCNSFINIADVSAIANDYGYNATSEYGQWPLP